jgi:hypothetical protein
VLRDWFMIRQPLALQLYFFLGALGNSKQALTQ